MEGMTKVAPRTLGKRAEVVLAKDPTPPSKNVIEVGGKVFDKFEKMGGRVGTGAPHSGRVCALASHTPKKS